MNPEKHETATIEESAIAEAAKQLDVSLSETAVAELAAYAKLIEKWNKVYNLTAIRQAEGILIQHIFDSLATVKPLLRQSSSRPFRLLDVGTGAGLPGVVIAIAMPHADIVCLDAVDKKIAFVTQARSELKLRNLQAVHSRIEKYEAASFDVITSRAYSSLAALTAPTQRLLNRSGVWMAMKGKTPESEFADLQGVDVFHVEQLIVPRLHAERCLVWMRPCDTE